MADTRTTTTPTYTTVSTEKSGSGALWFIVGGVVVAIAVIAWLLAGGSVSTPSASAPAGDVSISVEDNSAPSTTNVEPAPVEPAPAEPAPAPEAAPAEAAPSGN